MKYLHVLLIAILISSCCGTKKVVENAPKDIAKTKSVTVEDIPVVVEDSITETIEIIDNDGNTIREDDHIEEEEPQPEHDTTLIIFDHDPFDVLLQKYVSPEGNVDYKGLKTETKALRNYIASLGENKPKGTWIKEEKLAYWINAYNAMTLDLIIRNYPTKSIKDIDKPWQQRLWKLGEKWYNLDEIEHQIIRKMGEPRIHFALVCAAQSCPKLYNKAFTADYLDDDLTRLTEEFLNDSSKNIITENNLKLSKIFKWFAKDFKENGSLIDFLNDYSNVNISSKAKKSFNDYNWDLND